MRKDRPLDATTLTRRQVLQRFGAVGGSSLVLGAMDAMEMMGAPSAPRPVLSGAPPAGTKVTILGAGVSGLVTAYELGKLGYNYQVLEARDRVGGLNWSVKRGDTHTEMGPSTTATGATTYNVSGTGETQVCKFDEGQYINGGPWRLRQRDTLVLDLCREVGVPLERFIDETTWMQNDNPAIGPLAGKGVNLRDLKLDLWGNTAELLAKAIDQNRLDLPLSTEDKARLLQFLVQGGLLNNADRVYTGGANLRVSSGKYDLSALLQSGFASQVRSVYSGTGGVDPVLQPVGGMQSFPLGLARAIGPKKITFGAEVVTVRQTETNVKIVYKETKNGKQHEITTDYVVLCLPMPVLKLLDINLSPEMKTAVMGTTNSAIGKMGLQMKRRFWEQDNKIFGGHLGYTPFNPAAAPAVAAAPAPAAAAGGAGGGRGGAAAPAGGGGGGAAPNPLPSFSYPAERPWEAKGVLLGFYGNASIASPSGKPLVDLPLKDRIEHVLFHSSKIHPQMRAEFETAYVVWWPRIKYSLAAYGNGPGQLLPQLQKADGRVYIGCAGASGEPSWQEGACEAALHAVEILHKRVMA